MSCLTTATNFDLDLANITISHLAMVESTSSARCELKDFLPGFAPNVICTFPNPSDSSESVILSAHYDSRGSFGSTRAPGGDDDASGSAHLLAIAEAVGKTGVEFQKKVIFGWFAGEEQGLLGSHAFAGEFGFLTRMWIQLISGYRGIE